MTINKIIRLGFQNLLLATPLAISLNASSEDTEKFIKRLQQDPQALVQGERQFLLNCASCHKKDLSGAAGFNLKDGEWVHGAQPEDILNSIQRGFTQAGMPGFGPILSDEDQYAIVAYILSKREGFENLSYGIYQLDSEQDTTFSASDMVKSGPLRNNFADFDLPEIPNYAIEFKGTFHAPKTETTYLYAQRIEDVKIDVEVNDKLIKPSRYGRVQKWLLHRGEQSLSFTYYSGSAKKHLRNVELYVVNEDDSIKLFPVSLKALINSKNSVFDVKAIDRYAVQQKKIVKLPPNSIAIGSPEQINYAFNSKSCAINGMWKGDLLNVGPNIDGRGKDGSIPLGDWVFHFPQQLIPRIGDRATDRCTFIKYRINEDAPEFYHAINNVELSTTSDFSRAGYARFSYRVIKNPENIALLKFDLPKAKGLRFESPNGKVQGSILTVDISHNAHFSIELEWREGK